MARIWLNFDLSDVKEVIDEICTLTNEIGPAQIPNHIREKVYMIGQDVTSVIDTSSLELSFREPCLVQPSGELLTVLAVLRALASLKKQSEK